MSRTLTACLAAAALAASAAASAAAPQPPQATPAADYTAGFDHARGCWIRREEPDGHATALLRLLPSPEHPDWLNGQLTRLPSDDPDRRLHVWLSRDGRRAVLASQPLADPMKAPAAAEPAPQIRPLAKRYPPGRTPGSSQSLVLFPQPRVEFARLPAATPATGDWPADALNADYVAGAPATGTRKLRVQASEDRLTLTLPGIGPGRDAVLFDGRRDGCD
ncbi:hypothetical protein J5226_18980 [Lysobacter sp. K5869]|uniref:hypothetical protein n=1 Tax=Lysobacter sp. K5869 TaxID=2820808 RepID=UPI001C05FACD|nr:hypothetical protein [Lysobacter sp. K5869]QWP75674.1 hypothetical protein J5226_18980 [Lysobacter sp. K5869]